MLNEQHIPWSVGNLVNMAEQEIGIPFHSQYCSSALAPLLKPVMLLMSKHGSDEYHNVLNIDSEAAEKFSL